MTVHYRHAGGQHSSSQTRMHTVRKKGTKTMLKLECNGAPTIAVGAPKDCVRLGSCPLWLCSRGRVLPVTVERCELHSRIGSILGTRSKRGNIMSTFFGAKDTFKWSADDGEYGQRGPFTRMCPGNPNRALGAG